MIFSRKKTYDIPSGVFNHYEHEGKIYSNEIYPLHKMRHHAAIPNEMDELTKKIIKNLTRLNQLYEYRDKDILPWDDMETIKPNIKARFTGFIHASTIKLNEQFTQFKNLQDEYKRLSNQIREIDESLEEEQNDE